MTRADDTVALIRELWVEMCRPPRNRTAGNVPLYDERVRCVRCREYLTAPERCANCGRHA